MSKGLNSGAQGTCPDRALENADLPRTNGKRLDEVAQLLALGILRLRARKDGVSQTGVDFAAEQSVCGTEPETHGESE